MRLSWIASISIAIVVGGAANARADLLFDNGPPDLVNVHHSDFDDSSPSDTVLLGDDFTLASDSVLSEVRWAGVYAFDNVPPSADDFSIRIYDFSGAVPATDPLASFAVGNVSRTLSGSMIDILDVYTYEATVPDLMLAAGHYLISIVNNTTGTDSDWYWADSSQSGNAFARDADSLPWTPYNGNVGLSFSLSGTASVPEPASLLLLGLATTIILAARRRRAAVA